MALNAKYIQYLGEITTAMTDDNSLMKKQLDDIQVQFDRYGLTNEQVATLLSTVYTQSIQYINQYASSGAIALLETEQKDDLNLSQINLTEQKIATEVEMTNLTNSKKILTDNQSLKVIEDTVLVTKQENLVDRQKQGYDDNLLTKVSDQWGGSYQFAINAGDSATATSDRSQLATILTTIEDRVDTVVGT